MDKTKLKNLMTIGYWVMIVVVIAFCIFLFFYLSSNAKQCIKNPFVYGAEKMGDIYCSCVQFKKNDIFPAAFSFNGSDFIT